MLGLKFTSTKHSWWMFDSHIEQEKNKLRRVTEPTHWQPFYTYSTNAHFLGKMISYSFLVKISDGSNINLSNIKQTQTSLLKL